ncbi:MAG: NAD(P)/FAD-dependent oxidoreductase [Bacillota bacterium]|nr:MAG: NAD(P)/FAD-dependent oxidoreductase [Bacillota bacterium]
MYDAVFIGSGHNNLAAAIMLAEAGWKVIVLEQADDVGGAIRTVESTLPGFRHDAFSNTHILIFISPFYKRFAKDLAKHGLNYLHYKVNISSLFPDGDVVSMFPEIEGTLESLGRQSPEDAEGWKKLFAFYQEMRETIITLLSAPIPSLSDLAALAGPRLRLGSRGNMEFVQMMMLPARTLADHYFSTEKVKAWFVPWVLHPTFSPESASGGFFGWVVMSVAQDPKTGLAIPEGGGGGLTSAMASLLRSLGGEVRTGARVSRVIVRRKRAAGVELADGTKVEADRAVVAGTAPTKLFQDLVEARHLPEEFLGRVSRYRYGPPVVKIDYALSRPPAWKAEDARRAGLVHIGASMSDMSQAFNQALNGYLPAAPLLIITQPTIIDPTRAPAGKHTLWVVVRVPDEVKGDAAGKLHPRPWLHLKEAFADRVSDIIEDYAPGFRESVLARSVMSPEDLEEANPNLVQGDAGGGTMALDQLFMFRPFPGWSRFRTPVPRLYLCSAGNHPALGIHALSGYALANMLL